MLLVTELQLVENPEIKAFAEKLMSILQIKVRIMMLLSMCVTLFTQTQFDSLFVS